MGAVTRGVSGVKVFLIFVVNYIDNKVTYELLTYEYNYFRQVDEVGH